MAAPSGDVQGAGAIPLRVNLLGRFSISLGEKTTGRWERPPARRLCQLLLVSPGHRITRDAAYEALFPELGPAAASAALSKALSTARAALAGLGARGAGLLQANRTHIWADLDGPSELDLEIQEERLRSALGAAPGTERDNLLALALADEGTLLEDEPYADWAVRPREHLEWARQEARLVLARDRAKGKGRSAPESVVSAWEDCLLHDPSCEEAASALMRLYLSQKRHSLVDSTYKRCRSALDELGLSVSPALEEVHAAATLAALSPLPHEGRPAPPHKEERRLVSVVFAELSGPVASGRRLGPEEVRELVGGALAQVLAEVEALGGMVTSVSGTGIVALFGAPEAHEDDPERALRAAFRAMNAVATGNSGLSLRAGVETGPAVVGPIGLGGAAHYGAVGEVVSDAAVLQSIAHPTSVLVGPATKRATEGLFEWGPSEEVVAVPGTKPLTATYLEHPKARPTGQSGRRRLAGSALLVGRDVEMAVVRQALREVTSGRGSVLVIVGEPGLGKTRLVHECRKLFMAWVGAGSGRLPLWLEGRAASYLSSRPYGLYQQLLSAWVGASPEDGETVARAALERAMKAALKAAADDEQVHLLGRVMGLRPTRSASPLSQLGPEQLQKASFAAVAALFSGLVSHGPTLVVLEDVHWADPTSLRLTEELCCLTTQGPMLVVLTRRPSPDPGAAALETRLGAAADLMMSKVELAPLDELAERDLARALLGGASPDDVVEIVSRGVEGNPLFLEERLASLLETRALTRTGQGAWRVDDASPVELPEAIERLVRSRVDRLPTGARDAISAASVLGPEFALGSLSAMTELEGGLAPAISDLCAAGLLVELRRAPEPAYRFRHGLIQETTYKGLLRGERRSLHSRAAWGLEQASAGRLEEVAGLLGHHFALAGEVGRAVHYLELAGDRAVSAFANDEARSSYQWALELLGDEPANVAPAAELWMKLGRLAWRLGRFDEGRAAYNEAVGLAGSRDEPVLAARALRWLGAIETAGHRHEEALAALDAAEARLESCPDSAADSSAETWLDIQLERSNLLYWRNEPAAEAEVLERVRPIVESRGTPRQRIDFYAAVSAQRSRANRYVVDESILADCRAAWSAVVDGGLEKEMFWIGFNLGFALLWYGDLTGAQAQLKRILDMSRSADDKTLELRCLIYLSLAHLRQHDVERVKELAPEGEELARNLAFPEYVGMGKAMLSWVAWKEGRPADVEALSREALDLWAECVVHYSWCWAGLWPLIAVRLDGGYVEGAIDAARQLLGPDQQRLPEPLESAVRSAVGTWDKGDAGPAGRILSDALELACQYRYA